jgi:hypothetical protein
MEAEGSHREEGVEYWVRPMEIGIIKTTCPNLILDFLYPYHKVRIFIEYHCVCPLLGIGTLPTLLSPASVRLPPDWVGHSRLRVRGWGSPNYDDWRKSLALCRLCGWDPWTCPILILSSYCPY